jgi:5-methylcytosine-specific restriction endonuclease McrA
MGEPLRDIRLLKKPRLIDKETARKEAERKWLSVCREVDARDKYRCLCCERKVKRTLTARADRIERHHVIPKSLSGASEPWNVITLCLECHFKRHVTGELSIRHSLRHGWVIFQAAWEQWTVQL